jgi:hypothetical protein
MKNKYTKKQKMRNKTIIRMHVYIHTYISIHILNVYLFIVFLFFADRGLEIRLLKGREDLIPMMMMMFTY